MNELELIQVALASPKQSGKAPIVRQYEEELEKRFRVKHAVSVNSGSAAIQTALTAVGAGPGRSVIVSATAPLPTLLPIAATGARIQFVDCQSNNPSIEADSVGDAIHKDVVAAVEVPLWGYPQDYSKLMSLLSSYGIPLIEDAAQAHGALIGKRSVGTIAALGCFSTHEKKLLSTGEGGFILTDDDELAERTRKFSRLGYLDGASQGMNFKISAFTAAVGLARIPKLDEHVNRRLKVRETIMSQLHALGFRELSHIGQPNGYNAVVDVDGVLNYGELHSSLAAHGIKTDIIQYGYKCGYKHTVFADRQAKCPNAEDLVHRLVQLPTDGQDADSVVAAFSSAVKR